MVNGLVTKLQENQPFKQDIENIIVMAKSNLILIKIIQIIIVLDKLTKHILKIFIMVSNCTTIQYVSFKID